ncbi:hypothetical protein PFISCL1PPCAC_27267, partial [Pristionchus fissidentatus]
MKFLVFSSLLLAVVIANFDPFNKLKDTENLLKNKTTGLINDADNMRKELIDDICKAAPPKNLKSIEAEIVEAWNAIEKAVTLIGGLPKVVYDETIQQAIDSYQQIKADAAKMVNINITLPKIPDEVVIEGITIPLK